MSHSVAVQVMTDASAGHFDPTLLKAFSRCADRFDRMFRQRFESRREIAVRRWDSLISFVAVGAFVAVVAGGSGWALVEATRGPFSVPNPERPAADETDSSDTSEPIRPIPLPCDLNVDKVRLGRRLFHERRLSRTNVIACADCHDLDQGGAGARARSVDIAQRRRELNAPTVFNCSLNFKQFWDGRADSLEEQIDGPVNSPKELDSDWRTLLTMLRNDSGYAADFAHLYPDGVREGNVKDAIATFERSLLTPNSRFDRFLRGDVDAITMEEAEGYRLFKGYGCVSCHQGVGVGGNMFATFGVLADYFAGRKDITHADLGRFNVTGNEADRYRFKVPSLRNVALTAPYFHDGSAPTLEAAVDVMAIHQLGRRLSDSDTSRIVRFLGTLTGEYQGVPLR